MDKNPEEMTSQTWASHLLSTKLSSTYTYTLSSPPTSSLRSISCSFDGLWVLFSAALRTKTRSPPADCNKVPSMAIKQTVNRDILYTLRNMHFTHTNFSYQPEVFQYVPVLFGSSTINKAFKLHSQSVYDHFGFLFAPGD